MGIRIALISLVMLASLSALPVESKGKNSSPGGRPLPNGAMIWDQKRVIVRDYTDEHLSPEIVDTIMDLNEILPKNAPRIVYSRQEEKSCSEILGKSSMWEATLADYDRVVGRGIIICEDTLPQTMFGGQIIGVTVGWEWNKPSVFDGAMIGIDRLYADSAVICHEFMHALTWIGDDYDSKPGESCVHGRLADPGPFDAKHLRRMYRMYERNT